VDFITAQRCYSEFWSGRGNVHDYRENLTGKMIAAEMDVAQNG